MAKKKNGFLSEFKTFALRGNVVDLAVGVIIGGAFQKIVTSVVNDLIMPWIGLLTGGTNFVDQFVILKMPEVLPEGITAEMITSVDIAKEVGATTFNYGAFITAVIDFIIMALIIFLLRGPIINYYHLIDIIKCACYTNNLSNSSFLIICRNDNRY